MSDPFWYDYMYDKYEFLLKSDVKIWYDKIIIKVNTLLNSVIYLRQVKSKLNVTKMKLDKKVKLTHVYLRLDKPK